MAPPNQLGKRVKLTQVARPFVYGSTAIPFHEVHNPKPPGAPDTHTHSWSVFVKGVDDVDITYWLKRVQFKLHESIPNHPGKPFVVNETGWGEFEMTMKLYYVPESGEKPQTIYHYLRLHPFGRTEEEKQAMLNETGEVRAWCFEEQLFNEPFDVFFNLLTSGAHPRGFPGGAAAAAAKPAGGKGKGKGTKSAALPPLPVPESGCEMWERSAMIPAANRPAQPFSSETEHLEIKKIQDAQATAEELAQAIAAEMKDKEELLRRLKAENAAPLLPPKTAA